MEGGTIRARLDLLLNLRDPTTGLPVREKDVRFCRDDKVLFAHGRGEGSFVFINVGRENSLMQIDAFGYEPKRLTVDYETLDPVLPEIDVFLIPSENTRRGESILTLKGQLSGLEAVEAIHPGRPVTSIREFDPKKRIMTVFQPNRRMNLTETYYGLYNAEKESFEDLIVRDELPGKRVRLRKTLEEEFTPNSPICRIIHGQVEEDGSYILRVRDDGKNLVYLVKYIVDGQTRYKEIDFHEITDEVRLD